MTTFRPQQFYRVLALISLAMAALFGWELARSYRVSSIEVGSVLFFVVSLGVLLWSARASLTRVHLAAQHLTVEAPLSPRRTIEFGQMLSVEEEGRMSKAIVLAYHPRTPDGLLDLERASTIFLPALQDQDTLYEWLVEKTPT